MRSSLIRWIALLVVVVFPFALGCASPPPPKKKVNREQIRQRADESMQSLDDEKAQRGR